MEEHVFGDILNEQVAAWFGRERHFIKRQFMRTAYNSIKGIKYIFENSSNISNHSCNYAFGAFSLKMT